MGVEEVGSRKNRNRKRSEGEWGCIICISYLVQWKIGGKVKVVK
jgi:hypothetical protein